MHLAFGRGRGLFEQEKPAVSRHVEAVRPELVQRRSTLEETLGPRDRREIGGISATGRPRLQRAVKFDTVAPNAKYVARRRDVRRRIAANQHEIRLTAWCDTPAIREAR